MKLYRQKNLKNVNKKKDVLERWCIKYELFIEKYYCGKYFCNNYDPTNKKNGICKYNKRYSNKMEIRKD